MTSAVGARASAAGPVGPSDDWQAARRRTRAQKRYGSWGIPNQGTEMGSDDLSYGCHEGAVKSEPPKEPVAGGLRAYLPLESRLFRA
jgi:hypothetical protein